MFAFFFQAEDGIRDVAVTGVQTCALPISYTGDGANGRFIDQLGFQPDVVIVKGDNAQVGRSEERRVGKECRRGRAAEPYIQKISGRSRISTERPRILLRPRHSAESL